MTLDKDWVLVPREAAEAMIYAGAGLWLGGTVHGLSEEWSDRLRKTWATMLAAAPPPVIDEAMVERFQRAYETYGQSGDLTTFRLKDDHARACLEAALRPGGGG